MERDYPRLFQRAVQQRGDVGVADDGPGTLAQCGEVHLVEDARHAVATTDAPDRIDGRIAQGRVQVAKAIRVAPREISLSVADVSPEGWLEAKRAAQLQRSRHIVLLEAGAGRCHDRDACAGREPWRS